MDFRPINYKLKCLYFNSVEDKSKLDENQVEYVDKLIIHFFILKTLTQDESMVEDSPAFKKLITWQFIQETRPFYMV
jgi:hypothetical protein